MSRTLKVTPGKALVPWADIEAEDMFNAQIALLRDLQTQRRHAIKAQQRIDRAMESFLARAIGSYHATDMPEDERKKTMAKAKRLRMEMEHASLRGMQATDFEDSGIGASTYKLNQISFSSRQPWDGHRKQVEDMMIESAKLLPVYPWIKSVAGVAALGLAVIVGEAGDLGGYSGPSKLWIRLGLGTIDGHRQNFVPKEITGEDRKKEWVRRGYSPPRRAEIYAFIEDSMFKHQWRGAKDADGKNITLSKQPVVTPAQPIGPYGEVYGERKEWNLARGFTPAHADKEAKRFMAKRFVRDLWIAWHEALEQCRLPSYAEAV